MDRPKPLPADRRASVWIQFLLGTAGVMVTTAGIYELTRERPARPATAYVPAEPAPTATPAPETSLEAIRRVQREAKIAEIRQRRAEADALRQRGRCLDGVLIIKEGNEYRSAGQCR